MPSISFDRLALPARVPIALLPTPVHELSGLRAVLGAGAPRILIKRDDLTGLAIGGNKARKLEYLFADARRSGADTLLTCGAAQSNHALQTAAAARKHGFKVRCVLYGTEPAGKDIGTTNSAAQGQASTGADHSRPIPPGSGAVLTGNVLLHSLLDTPIRWVKMQEGETRREQALRRGLREEAARVEEEGGKPYSIPTGGSTGVGAMGYVQAMQEAKGQLEAGGNAEVSALFFASGSGGTQAGMIVGARLLDWKTRIVGVEVEPIAKDASGTSPFHRAVHTLTQETSRLLNYPGAVTLHDVELCGEYSGPAYGAPTKEGQEALRLLAQSEGIFLDPVYTAKAFAALLGWIREGRFSPHETVLFWHTGGVAGLFAGH